MSEHSENTIKKKNILFYLVDQWPAHEFTRLGSQADTLYADRLAAKSTVFSNAFTTCTLCSPARASLLTGKWAHQNGVYDNCAVGYSIQEPLAEEHKTWIDVSVKAGYQVGYFGKWHLGEDGPKKRGAHAHDPDTDHRLNKTYYEREEKHTYAKVIPDPTNLSSFLKSGLEPFYGIQKSNRESSKPIIEANKGKKFIEEWAAGDRNKPFFLTVSTLSPHFPHFLPNEFESLLDPSTIKLPNNLHDTFEGKPAFQKIPWWPSMDTAKFSDDDWKIIINYALLHIKLADEALGLALNAIEENGLEEDTMIVFASDHGDMNGAHNRFDKGAYFYEEVWKVPLIIHMPGQTSRIEQRFVSLLDLGETFFDLIGESGNEKEVENERMGRSLLPLVKGEPVSIEKWPSRAYGVYDYYNGYSFAVRAIRNQRFKYVWNPQDVDEFYDLEADPGEMDNLYPVSEENLSSEAQSAKSQLKDELFEWMNTIGDPLPEKVGSLPKAGIIMATGEMGP